MRILQCHNSYLYPGGEDSVAISEAALLRSAGHTVIEYQRSNKELQGLSLSEKIKFYLSDIYFSKWTYEELRALIQKERPDVAHFHNSFFLMGPAAYEACFDAGVPVVQTLHNYRFLCAAGTFFRAGKVCEECLTCGRISGIKYGCWHDSKAASFVMTRVIESYLKRGILDKIGCFIALSEFSRGKFLEAGWDATRMVIKPNFIEQDPCLSVAAGQYVLYVGALQSYKGVQTLLKAWPLCQSPMPCKLVGTGPVEKDLHLMGTANVEWLGQQNFDEVITLIKGSLCVVVPSEWYENLPRVIVEAFACGKPVIASRLGALAELIEDKKTGFLFEPGNEQDLADQLNFFLQNPKQAKQMGIAARHVFEKKFTAAQNLKQVMGIYEKVALNKCV